MASDHVPDPEAAKKNGETKEASTAVGLVLAALVLAIFGVFFADAWQAQKDRSRPEESPRVEGQLAPLGQSATIAAIAADDETAARKRAEKEKEKQKSVRSPGEDLQGQAEPHSPQAPPKNDSPRELKPQTEPSGKDR